jgi:hypothetical protein
LFPFSSFFHSLLVSKIINISFYSYRTLKNFRKSCHTLNYFKNLCLSTRIL